MFSSTQEPRSEIASEPNHVFSKHEYSAISDNYGKLHTELCMIRRSLEKQVSCKSVEAMHTLPRSTRTSELQTPSNEKLNISIHSRDNPAITPCTWFTKV